MIWSVLLMLMVFYGFGIVFTEVVVQAHYPPDDEHGKSLKVFWGTLPRSIFTLLKAISGGVSWHEVVIPIAQISWTLVALFLCYFVFTYFVVLNVMTGVFCQSAIESASLDKELATMQLLADKQEWTMAMR